MYFPTTQWSLLARASLNGETTAREALEELCRRYWLPLHQFIRARGHKEAEAEDLTQEFVLHLLAHSTLKRADRMRGRFRSFLLGALMRFLGDEYDRRRAQKRGSGVVPAQFDEDQDDVSDAPSQDSILFDREWALVILENALGIVQREFEERAEANRFVTLRRFLPGS